jgi:hypothetical protein
MPMPRSNSTTHLQSQFPHFGPSGSYSKLPRRFKKAIYSIDSSEPSPEAESGILQ